ncbi:hypothetical protein ACE1SV_45690 [Streptomyces sp. E-15]
MSIPGADWSAAQPLSGRYTSIVTQGHSFSTLRDDHRLYGYPPRPKGCGGCLNWVYRPVAPAVPDPVVRITFRSGSRFTYRVS